MVSRGPSSLKSGVPQSTVPEPGALRVEQGQGWLCRSPSSMAVSGTLRHRLCVCVLGRGVPQSGRAGVSNHGGSPEPILTGHKA